MPKPGLQQSAQPCWFGPQHTPLLGWYHPARPDAGGAVRPCGVVLCPPFGHEYMVAYLAYKHLALRLAAAGFAVLFFDYENSGDSADSEGERIAGWQANIVCAAQQLRRMAGVEQVALFGLRLGALLAASVAQEAGAAALLLAAPLTSGRTYARELMVLRNMSALQPGPDSDPAHSVGEDELTGYEFSAATRSALGQLDLLKMPAPAMPVLILARDDIAGPETRLAQAWRDDRHHLQLSAVPGYAAMMTEDAHATCVPQQLWDAAVHWLGQQFPAGVMPTPAWPPACGSATIRTPAGELREELVGFAGLVGVLTHPSAPAGPQLPAVILSNVGANHRVGTHRLYVTLARTLAAQGFCVLRFDKAGIGYSKPTPQGQEHDVHGACGADDIRAAMQFLQESHGQRRMVLAGLCSGAYLSYLAALADARVAGLVLMNQQTYRWREGDTVEVRKRATIKSSAFYLRAAGDGATWKRLLTGQVAARQIAARLLQRMARRLRLRGQTLLTGLLRNQHLPGPVARHFRAMAARGTDLLFIFDANDSGVDLMSEQLGPRACLLQQQGVRVEILHGVDHTFTPRWSQRHLAALIADHLQQRFSGAAVRPAE